MGWAFLLGENCYIQLLEHSIYRVGSLFNHWMLNSYSNKIGSIWSSRYLFGIRLFLFMVFTPEFCAPYCLIFPNHKNSSFYITNCRKSTSWDCTSFLRFFIFSTQSLLGLLSLPLSFIFNIHQFCSYERWFTIWYLLWYDQFPLLNGHLIHNYLYLLRHHVFIQTLLLL